MGCSYSGFHTVSASFPSQEHCKPILRKKGPLPTPTPAWAHWWKKTGAPPQPYPQRLVCRSKGTRWGLGLGVEGQEEPYQGGDEDHTERDQQQTGGIPGPSAQPGLGNIRQTAQGDTGRGWGRVLIYFSTGKIEALRTLYLVLGRRQEKAFQGYPLNSKKPQAGAGGAGGPQVLPPTLGLPGAYSPRVPAAPGTLVRRRRCLWCSVSRWGQSR